MASRWKKVQEARSKPHARKHAHLAVAGAEGDAHEEALVLDLAHAVQGQLVGWGHVVVGHFLAPGRLLAHHAAAGELQVRAAVVGVPWHEEELLLQADVGLHRLHVKVQVLAQPHALLK